MKTKAALTMASLVWLAASSLAMAQGPGGAVTVSVVRAAPARSAANAGLRLRALRAQAAELEADRAATLARLDQSMAAMQAAVRALRTEEQRVAKGATPRSRLRPLQARVAQHQASVESARGQLARITHQQFSLRLALRRQDLPRGSRDHRLPQALTHPKPPLEVVRGTSGYYVRSQSLAGSPFVVDSLTTLLARAEAEEMQANNDQRTAEAQIELAAEARDRTKQLVTQGQASQAELTTAEAEFLKARSSLDTARLRHQQRQDERERIARLAALQRPIDVELQNAPIRQAAQSIAQAAGITVRVEDAVPTDRRLTVAARGVPLATILDSIARQSGLLIAPYQDGVSLKPMPTLEVNGQRTNFMSPFAPWSSEWGMNPAASAGFAAPDEPLVGRLFRTGGGLVGALVAAGGGAVEAKPTDALTPQVSGTETPTPVTGTTLAPDGTRSPEPRVSVVGNVARPGVYPLRPGDRVSDLLMRAGGASAGTFRLALIRQDEKGDALERELDMKPIMARPDAPENIPLRPGDILSVQLPPAAGRRATEPKDLSAAAPPVALSPAPGNPPYSVPPGGTPAPYPIGAGAPAPEAWQPYYRFNTPSGSYYGSSAPGSTMGPVSVTALSENSFVVASPAAAPDGGPAVSLTVYRLEGAQLRVVSTTLHRLSTAAAGPAGQYRRSNRLRPQAPEAGSFSSTSPAPQPPAATPQAR